MIAGIVGAVLLILAVANYYYLKNAHSSFEKYYAFRGCELLIQRQPDYGICKTKAGEVIKIVKINNLWYLDGDGPGVW